MAQCAALRQRPAGGIGARLARRAAVAERQGPGLDRGWGRDVWRGLRCAAMVVAALCLASAALAADVARLDPALAAWVSSGGSPRGAAPEGLQTTVSPTGEARAKVLATVREAPGLTLGGVPVSFATASVAVVSVTAGELAGLLADERVTYVEASWRASPSLDVSVETVRADRVHEAVPGAQGEGVIVGIVDSGIDYRHLDFRTDQDGDGFEESTRVLALWDQTWGLFGASYDRADIEAALAEPGDGTVKQVDRDGHGTHVAGIAAGDGSSSSAGFEGVAPSAWIIAVKTTFFTADILEAVGFIFQEAERRAMPAVVNLSLGGHAGPHDGTSALERGLEELVRKPGRAIVVAAGNEGNLPIHISGTLDRGAKTFELQAGAREASMELWYPGDSTFSVSMSSPSGALVVAPAGGTSGYVPTPDGTAYIDNASLGRNPNNGDREVVVRITETAAGARWRITVRDEGGGGRFDGWVTTLAGTIVGGDAVSTIDEPGNSRGVVTVGSFDSKASWPSTAGDQDDAGNVAPGALSAFSSRGPTRDGRIKPDLTAPGAWICSSLSAWVQAPADERHPDGVHVVRRGTSMAAPHVTGTVALLLELEPALSADEIRDTLIESARRDADVSVGPQWGYGKLDAWSAAQSLGGGGLPPPAVRPTLRIVDNPARGRAQFSYVLPPGTRSAWLRVYDVAGALVYEVALRAGATDEIWDLSTRRGVQATAGLYLCVVASDRGASSIAPLVVAP